MLANAVAEIVPAIIAQLTVGLELPGIRIIEDHFRAAGHVRCAAEHPRHFRGNRVQHFAGCFARGYPFGIGGKFGNGAVPALGQAARADEFDLCRLVRIFRRVVGEQLLPFRPRVGPALSHMRGEMLPHAVRYHEEFVGIEAEELLGAPDLVRPERLAVRGGRVVLAGRAVADMAVHVDQRRLIVGRKEGVVGRRELAEIIGIRDMDHVPAIRLEAFRHVLGEGDAGVAVDGHVVVVEDPAKIR